MDFKLVSDYKPQGDQGRAIDALLHGVYDREQHQVLLGVTGSGKTYTMAKVIEAVNRPALVMAHNKTFGGTALSRVQEFLFPHNAVEYFVSYYDYYQPEAYVPPPTSSSRKKQPLTMNSTSCASPRPARYSNAAMP